MSSTHRTILVTTLALAMTLAACSSGGDSSSSTPAPSSGSKAACAWPTRADRATQNLAYPDTSATYWVTSYRLAPGEHLELRGRFPDARYMSFITYGPAGGVRNVLADRDITPVAGSANPFASDHPSSPTPGRYVVRVGSSAAGDVNVVGAAGSEPDSGAPPPTSTSGAAPKPLGSGRAGTSGVVSGTVIYRVYLPTRRDDPTGGAGLPSVRVVQADEARTPVPTCVHPGKNPNAEAIVRANGPATDRPAPAEPIFIRPDTRASTLYPNPDNVYVATIVHYEPGRMVVVRGKAPTFPDTGTGDPITEREQVRFWSLCTNEYRKPYPVFACVPDERVVLDAGGRYTFVVSTRADRPANATAANGVTWLDWGSTKVNMLLLFRNMLASPDFAESAIRLPPGATATSSMGAYAPRGVYCASTAFAQGGPDACPSTG